MGPTSDPFSRARLVNCATSHDVPVSPRRCQVQPYGTSNRSAYSLVSPVYPPGDALEGVFPLYPLTEDSEPEAAAGGGEDPEVEDEGDKGGNPGTGE